MSAEILREAAVALREDWTIRAEHGDLHGQFHLAAADWLDASAANLRGIPGQKITPSPYEEHALAVARAYLGADQ